MRISDWGSDVCSSDLQGVAHRLGQRNSARAKAIGAARDQPHALPSQALIARLSWRRRGLTRLDLILSTRSEEHTSELQSLMRISYAVFCLKKKITKSN